MVMRACTCVFVNRCAVCFYSQNVATLPFGILSFNITVNSEIFARILFSRIALKGIFAAFKLRN